VDPEVSLDRVLAELCRTEGVVGGVLCDDEGETVVSAQGTAELPPQAHARAADHVPRSLPLSVPVPEFLLRLGSAETCGLLRSFQRTGRDKLAGALRTLQVRYAALDVLVHTLPQDFYLVLVVRRPTLLSTVAAKLQDASRQLAPHLQ
jgi:hypothetical protein